MPDNPIDLDHLEARLRDSLSVTNYGVAERDRDIAKTGALLSIARSLEANKVPDDWEALEGPSGAVLGWFDPLVARAIAQALGASQARAEGDESEGDDEAPIEVGAAVALTAALEQALDLGDPSLAGLGEVLDLGISEGTEWALVKWDDEAAGTDKVWLTDLTVIGQADVTVTVDEDEAEVVESTIDATLATLNAEADGEPDLPVTTDVGIDIEPDTEAPEAPEPEVDDDDIDADFDTVVEPAPVDGLSALRKGKGGKR